MTLHRNAQNFDDEARGRIKDAREMVKCIENAYSECDCSLTPTEMLTVLSDDLEYALTWIEKLIVRGAPPI
jgi:hypothetical protein